MKKSLLCVLICLMGSFFLSGCGKPAIPPPENIMQPTQALFEGLDLLNPQGIPKQESQLGQERYYIVVDDGLGMKGFVSTYCQSYRAVLTAVSGMTMSNQTTCVRASDLVNEKTYSNRTINKFFGEACSEDYFQLESNDIASIIREMTEEYASHPDQVMILISDMMIPTEDDCNDVAMALQSSVINPDHATLGIIGIMGDFCGTIENLPVSPTTGYRRKISDYMVKDKDANGNFKHPLYILFFGNDQAVLNALEKSMSALTDGKSQEQRKDIQALYLSEYGITRRGEDDITTIFELGDPYGNTANYPGYFLIKGMLDSNGEEIFESTIDISETHQQMLNAIPIAKLYTEKRGSTKNNVTITCTVPFCLIDSSVDGATIVDTNNLLKTVQELPFKQKDYKVEATVQYLDFNTSFKTWIPADADLVKVEKAEIDEAHQNISIVLSINTELLQVDEPLLCEVSVRVKIVPNSSIENALYSSLWLKDWELILDNFDNESISSSQAATSARYTEATTGRTPFIYQLIYHGLVEQQMKKFVDVIQTETYNCVQNTIFGIVVRDMAIKYEKNYSWDAKEDFDGWAFSENQANEILNPSSENSK